MEEPLSINFFTKNAAASKSTTGVNGQFVFSQVLIDCLVRLKPHEQDMKELIDHCQKQYVDDSMELSNIHEFQQSYSADRVLWWYTRESFFYKTLNAALRDQNVHLLFLFRVFISDIQNQLKINQSQTSLRVYRGQMISNDELDILKQRCGQIISVNSFFSTSTDYQYALSFLDTSPSTDTLKAVLFEIDADPKLVTTKPFADISSHSQFKGEAEVLFMLGSIFRLISIEQNNDEQVLTIRMTLCSENEHDLKEALMYMKQQTGNGETNLRVFAKTLCKMGKFDLAEQYLTRLLKQIPSRDPLCSSVYEDLSEVASQLGEYDKSMEWLQKSLESKKTGKFISSICKSGEKIGQ